MKNELMCMLEELQHYKRDKTDLMQFYIAERLNKSFDLYCKELQYSKMFLERKHEKSIIKRLNKLNDKYN